MDFLAAVVAIVALIFVLKMRTRLTALELRIAELTGTQPAPLQPPWGTPPAPEQTFAAPAAPAPAPFAQMDEAAIDTAIRDAAPPAPPPPAEPEAPRKSFEERFGANWVV